MRYIDTPESLKYACEAIAASPWAALDTEADSLHHYVEKLCLVQVSIPDEDFVIDPLVPLDLSSLTDTLSRKPLILHGADFDIRILKRFYGFSPREIFDTMIAAQLLGYDKQGLADLAHKHCGVTLSKSSQKADWSQRPLEEKLLAYAANDTHYLRSIRLVMEEELRSLGRLEWQRQCCERLLRTLAAGRESRVDSESPWQIKGSKILSGKALAILKELWLWREEEARRRDRPSFKVLHSETLIEIACWAEGNPGLDVDLLPKAPRNVKRELRDILNELLRRGAAAPPLRYVEDKKFKASKRLDAAAKTRLDALKKEREKIALELKIHPSLLGTNTILEILAGERPQSREAMAALGCLMPWQIEVVAEGFLRIL